MTICNINEQRASYLCELHGFHAGAGRCTQQRGTKTIKSAHLQPATASTTHTKPCRTLFSLHNNERIYYYSSVHVWVYHPCKHFNFRILLHTFRALAAIMFCRRVWAALHYYSHWAMAAAFVRMPCVWRVCVCVKNEKHFGIDGLHTRTSHTGANVRKWLPMGFQRHVAWLCVASKTHTHFTWRTEKYGDLTLYVMPLPIWWWFAECNMGKHSGACFDGHPYERRTLGSRLKVGEEILSNYYNPSENIHSTG